MSPRKSSACPYAPSRVPSSLTKFEMLRSVTPSLSRVAVLVNPTNASQHLTILRTRGLVHNRKRRNQVLYSVRLGLWGLVLGSNMLWDCLGCYQCQEHCPQGVGVTDVLYELKNVAIARAAAAAAADGSGARA